MALAVRLYLTHRSDTMESFNPNRFSHSEPLFLQDHADLVRFVRRNAVRHRSFVALVLVSSDPFGRQTVRSAVVRYGIVVLACWRPRCRRHTFRHGPQMKKPFQKGIVVVGGRYRRPLTMVAMVKSCLLDRHDDGLTESVA